VAFGANIEVDLELLNMGGSIAAYATDRETPQIPFWPMAFKNSGYSFWEVTTFQGTQKC
jgi:NADPH:quinone reductase